MLSTSLKDAFIQLQLLKNMLKISKIVVQYGQKKVLQTLSLSIPQASIHGVVGLNGAGKTTLFKAISSRVGVQAGEILWQDHPIERSDVGYLETHPYFYSRITGLEYLELLGINRPHFDFIQWNHLFELPLKELINNYSTGMKKKLAFLGMLALNRPVLLLDEPFNGVDLASNEKIKQVILQLKAEGKTILVSSHILETLTHMCDAVSLLHEGQFTQTCQTEDSQLLQKELQQIFKIR